MDELGRHDRLGCSIFMFQDDDFPVAYRAGAWLAEFGRLLRDTGLARTAMWKINCRPDEIRRETFARMKEDGLFLVYLGIESGTDAGLRLMDKRISADTNLRAAACLKDLGIAFDYGFMAFDPSSTLDTVAENLDFLDALVGDGSSPVTFCKMLPYAGTRVERELREEGRLVGPVGGEDYRFRDPRVDDLYEMMAGAFGDWIGDHAGLLNLARWVRHYQMVYRRFFGASTEFERLAARARDVIAQSNRDLTAISRRMIALCREGPRGGAAAGDGLRSEVAALHARHRRALEQVIDELEHLPRNVDAVTA